MVCLPLLPPISGNIIIQLERYFRFVFEHSLARNGVLKFHSCYLPNVYSHDLKWEVTRVNKC